MVKDGDFSRGANRDVAPLSYFGTKLTHSFSFPAEVVQTFGYQCRNSEELNRMWETCKISIGKRCQNTRNKNKQT